MIGEKFAEKILKKALSACPAEGAMAIISGGKKDSIRFQGEYIHQDMIQKDYSLKVIATDKGRSGSATCNDFSDETIISTAQKAADIAKIQTHAGRFKLYPFNAFNDSGRLYDNRVMDESSENKARVIDILMKKARSEGLRALGYMANGDNITAFMNSMSDNMAYHVQTGASFSITVENDGGGSGHGNWDGCFLDEEAPARAFEHAASISRINRTPISIEPGIYDAVLAPEAVMELLDYLCWTGFGGLAFLEKRSILSGKIGQKLFSDKVTIIDDPNHPLTPGRLFDYEGTVKKPLVMVDKGIAVSPALDTETSEKCKMQNTGHAAPFPGTWGPSPSHIRMLPGDKTREELISEVNDGLLINSFFYTNITAPLKCSITTMTRNGTFRIKYGKLESSVNDLRINVNIPELLSNIIGISKDGETFGTYGITWAPTIAVKGLRVTGSKKE